MAGYFSKLSAKQQKRLLALAEAHYSPQVRALTGLLFDSLKLSLPNTLKRSLNPTTTYKLQLDKALWPLAKKWNIQ